VLKNDVAGFSLSYPRGWRLAGRVVSTEFASGAGCQSVRVVDLAAPVNAGPGAEVHQSLVQLCWRRVSGDALEDFMRKTYGDRLSSLFEKTTLAGVSAFRTVSQYSKTFFVDSGSARLQIVASVVADPGKRALRLAQVGRIVASLSLTR
jgi:hypothetical protein